MDIYKYISIYTWCTSFIRRLTIDPCLPDSIKNLTITRKFRDAVYNITISNEKHERVSSLIVNGNEITGNTVPYNKDTKVYDVTVNI